MRVPDDGDPLQVCLDYCATVNANISAFLRDKTHRMVFSAERAKTDFRRFWTLIGATGDFDTALCEWDLNHNASTSPDIAAARPGALQMTLGKIRRITQSLPT
jgi:hypothetical protein